MKCVVCGKAIDEDVEQYACVWGEGTTIVGFAHLHCVDGMKDITGEVRGEGEE